MPDLNPYDELDPYARHHRLRHGDHAEYELWLRSRTWRALRTRLIKQSDGACEHCGRNYLVVLELHHLTYARLGCELDDDIEVLCRLCHEQADDARRTRRRVHSYLELDISARDDWLEPEGVITWP